MVDLFHRDSLIRQKSLVAAVIIGKSYLARMKVHTRLHFAKHSCWGLSSTSERYEQLSHYFRGGLMPQRSLQAILSL